ncbi:MAG: hypothetical protein ABI995_12805, partial [Acidobacteriota bacterium]
FVCSKLDCSVGSFGSFRISLGSFRNFSITLPGALPEWRALPSISHEERDWIDDGRENSHKTNSHGDGNSGDYG